MPSPTSLHELYIDQLRDLYDAEQQIIKALPEMIDAAQSEDLKEALNEHLDVTKEQASRLEKIFNNLGEKPKGERCKGMQGVLAEGSDLVGKIDNEEVRDAAIIASAQRVEHYEMAGYGTARTFATMLGENDAADLLEQTLSEEKEADDKLTDLAGEINAAANSEEGVESENETSATGKSTKRQTAATTKRKKSAA
ncbi:MAG: ferritin-like domain-containing protein [Candidatus Sulfotelmatobacter sp.]